MSKLPGWLQKLLQIWRFRKEEAAREEVDGTQRREKATVFAISWVLALGLWFLVNLGKNFSVAIQFPLVWGEVEAGRAPVQELPGKVEATIYGEGWVILSLKNNTPPVRVDAQSGDVNVYEMIRVIMNTYPQASVTKVFPSTIQVQLDKKVSRKVPVRSLVDIQFTASHALLGQPRLEPDSVVLTGAKALVEAIGYWETEPVVLRNVKTNVNTPVMLKAPPNVLELSRADVQFTASVSEFTEGEVRVPVKMRGSGQGRQVTFSPALISVRYDVPVGDYAATQDRPPFEAVVAWDEIANDSSGFASPTIVDIGRNPDIRLRTYQPRRVAYYFTIPAALPKRE
jgi:hypothetical protein